MDRLKLDEIQQTIREKPFDIIINGKSLTVTDAEDIYYWHTSGDYFSLRNKQNTTINVKFKPAPTDYE